MMASAPCNGVVLLVEDDEDTRELLTTVLQRRGYLVATAENGVAAMAILGATKAICFVLIDLFMPQMDGFEMLHAMQADAKLASLPRCISTSAPNLAPPGVTCLSKPVDLSLLFALVERHCGARDAMPAATGQGSPP